MLIPIVMADGAKISKVVLGTSRALFFMTFVPLAQRIQHTGRDPFPTWVIVSMDQELHFIPS